MENAWLRRKMFYVRRSAGGFSTSTVCERVPVQDGSTNHQDDVKNGQNGTSSTISPVFLGYSRVIKHGNRQLPISGVFPIKTSIYFGNFPAN